MRPTIRKIAIDSLVKSGQAKRVKDSRFYALIRARGDARPESNWTAGRDDCRHPEWWTASDVDSAEFEVTELVAAWVRALQPEYVIETGTAFGQTARAIGKALRKNGHGRLDTIEVNPNRVRQARIVTRGLPVIVNECPSLEFTPAAPIEYRVV